MKDQDLLRDLYYHLMDVAERADAAGWPEIPPIDGEPHPCQELYVNNEKLFQRLKAEIGEE